jgi:cytochrome c553
MKALCAAFAAVMIAGQAPSPNPAANLTGNAERGKTLFTVTYKCASCHGTTAESGSPRLVPMRRTQENFIAYVQKMCMRTSNQSPSALRHQRRVFQS